MISRRDILLGAASVLGASATGGVARPFIESIAGTRRNIPYGAAVRGSLLQSDTAYRQAVLGYCDQIVAEGGFLFGDLRPQRNQFHFDEADTIAAFAQANGLPLRGHTLVWYGVMPKWTEEIATSLEAERELVRHIETVVSRYKSTIRSWNVVNEPLRDDATRAADLRPFIWQRRLGSDYIAIALRAARAADPTAQLVINEYDVEFVGDRFRGKRQAFLQLVRALLDQGAPIDAIGLQGHLKGELDIDADGIGSFVREMKRAGLEILVTELDVVDHKLPADTHRRDADVAKRARDFLRAIAAEAPLAAVLTWGITDRYTWVPMYFKREDGLANRPLPLDEFYQAKPFMQVLEHLRYGV